MNDYKHISPRPMASHITLRHRNTRNTTKLYFHTWSNVQNYLLEVYEMRSHVVPGNRSLSLRRTSTDSERLELNRPCGRGRHLMNCPDFTSSQPYGPADMPKRLARFAPPDECPICDYECHDMRRRRMCEFRRAGVRLALYPQPQRRSPGVDLVCCAMM